MSDDQVRRDELAQMIVREWMDGTFGIINSKTGELEMRPKPASRIAAIVFDMIQASRAEGRREILREIAGIRVADGETCPFCRVRVGFFDGALHGHVHASNYGSSCLLLRATKETER